MITSLPKILITGGDGQLAQSLCHHPLAHTFHVIACSRSALDITHKKSIETAIIQHQPQWIINTAAYTLVDKAEQEKEEAMRINHLGALNLATLCQEKNVPLIHLSTDYVFDGTKNSPYLEDDRAHPINAYGESKWLGEEAIRKYHDQHLILRVSGVFSEYGNNFLKTILRLAKEKKELRIVADQMTCPTYAGDIAGTIFTCLTKPAAWGVYHYCSKPSVSWHAFATAIVNEAKCHQSLSVEAIQAITTAEYPTPAKRPAYSVLHCQKLFSAFGIAQPDWKKGIFSSLIALNKSL